MKFSILITSFNKGKYIEECIKSCLKQTYNNFEIIVCDNYSTDNSEEIFTRYKKKIVLLKKKKISNSSALNQIDLFKLGALKAKGNYICLLDADDYFFPKKLETFFPLTRLLLCLPRRIAIFRQNYIYTYNIFY